MRPCPNCGQDVAPTSDRFCPHCGAMLPWASAAGSNGTAAAASTPSRQPYQAPQTTYRPQQGAANTTPSYGQPQPQAPYGQPQPQAPYAQPQPQTPYVQPRAPYVQTDPNQGAFLGGVQGGNLPAPLQRTPTPAAPMGGAGPALNTLLSMGRSVAGSRSTRRSITPTRIALAIVAVVVALWLVWTLVHFVLTVLLPIVFVLAVLFLIYQYGIKRRLGRRLP